MNKQEFLDLGLSEEQAKKAEEASKKELEGYVSKHHFDEVDEARKKAEGDLAERNQQLEALKQSAGDSEDLQKQIQALQDEAKEKDAKYKEELKELKLTGAIKAVLAGKAQDEDLVAGLFDKSKLILGEDGKVTGLEEQLKSLQESKAFLFKQEEKKDDKPGFYKLGGNPPKNNNDGAAVSLKDAIAARYGM